MTGELRQRQKASAKPSNTYLYVAAESCIDNLTVHSPEQWDTCTKNELETVGALSADHSSVWPAEKTWRLAGDGGYRGVTRSMTSPRPHRIGEGRLAA